MEPGQNRKIAALTFNFYVHVFFGVDNMNLKYMDIAIKEAEKALKNDEVPVGCVIVKDDQIIEKAYNQKEKYNLVTKHAELIAIEKASKKLFIINFILSTAKLLYILTDLLFLSFSNILLTTLIFSVSKLDNPQ